MVMHLASALFSSTIEILRDIFSSVCLKNILRGENDALLVLGRVYCSCKEYENAWKSRGCI